MTIDLAAVRAAIPACQRVTYLNTGWSGPSPSPVVDAIQRQLELESTEGPASPQVIETHHDVDAEARAEAAALVGASVKEIAMLHNTTEGLHVVLNAFHWEPGDEVITFRPEHPAVLMSTLLLERKGVTVKVLELAPAEEAPTILSRIELAMGPRTRLICMSHVQYTSGLRMPLAEICSVAHRLGVQVMVDGAQAVGQMPLDLPALGVDYYSMPGQKWLLGPDGVGMLYVRADRLDALEPRNPYLAGLARAPQGPTTESARKFELSTSSMALRAGLTEAIRFIRAVGLDEIRSRNLVLAERLKKNLGLTEGASVLSPMAGESSTGLVSASLAGVTAPAAVGDLWSRWKIAARSIQELDAVRVSCHFFNTEQEIDGVSAALEELAQGAR